MAKFFIGLLVGLVFGGALIYYLFVGAPRVVQAPGVPIAPPDASMPAGTAQISMRQDFFNEVLATIFRDMRPPTFPLGSPGAECDGTITILPEGSGVKTAVSLEGDRLSAPLAFSGSYNSPFGCAKFTGWAQAGMELRFDANTQTVYGQLTIENVSLDGVSPVVSVFLTPIVQSTLNTRVNPIRILDGRQIAVNLPIAAAGSNLTAAVQDVRAEVKGGTLNLYVVYKMSGSAALPAASEPINSPTVP